MQYPRWSIKTYWALREVAFSGARVVENIEQRVFDRMLGVSTHGIVYTDDSLTATGSDNLYYDNSGWLPVRRALKDLDPGPTDVFVDLGSGKGQALLIAGQLPFRRVVGVEIYDELSECAKRNIERARPRLRTQDVDSVTANVLDWPFPDDASVVFMFNPFVGDTFHSVAGRIFESYDCRPRNLHIVYVIPWEHNWLLSTGRVVVDNIRPWRMPAFPLWWRRGLVIMSYRVVGPMESGTLEPQLPRRMSGQRRRALRDWSGPNDFCFGVSQPGQPTVFSRSLRHPAEAPQQPVSGPEQERVLFDLLARLASQSAACPVRARGQLPSGYHALSHDKIVALERFLMTLVPFAHVNQADAKVSGLFGHPQELDQPRRLLAEARVIRREPVREHGPCPEAEVRSNWNSRRVEDRQQATKSVAMDTKQVVHEVNDPWAVKNVGPSGPPVLEGFPVHQSSQI